MITLPKWMIDTFMLMVRFVVESYTIITLPLYRIIQKPEQVLEYANEVRATQEDPSNPYSEWKRGGDVPYHPLIDCNTIAEAIQQLAVLYDPDRLCLGYREVLEEQIQRDASGNVIRLDGKVLRKFKLADYKWLTYGDVYLRVNDIAKGLLVNGIKPKDRILFFTETRMETLLFTGSMALVGGCGVSVFATLDNDAIVHAVNESEAVACYTTYDLLYRITTLIDRCPKLTKIFYVEGPPGSEPIPTFSPKITLLPLTRIEEDGKNAPKNLAFDPLGEDDIPFIGYTSGTTGPPKGIYATTKQLKNAGMAVLPIVRDYIEGALRQIYVAYLPQAHIFEAAMETFAFLGGVRIGFATPFTLNESAPGLAEGVECDLKLLKPTCMTAVPLVLDRMRKEMYEKLRNRTPVSTALFDYLIQYKIKWTKKGYKTPLINFLICPKVREQFGGRLEHMAVGSAALDPDLQALIKAALNINLAQGYGSTETLGPVMCMDDHDLLHGYVGAPLHNIRARIVDWEEGGYRATDKPYPRGELVIGGPGVATGYFKNEALTKESFFDGNGFRYFQTGDIVEVLPDGRFKIIDRKKDLIKLANGEFFSLGKIEAALKNNDYIDNICVIGNALRDNLVALVVPHEKNFSALTKKLGLTGISLSKQCSDPQVKEIVYSSLVETGKQIKLHRREIPAEIFICSEFWSPDNDMLTAAMKLKRRNIHKKYMDVIEELFSNVDKRKRANNNNNVNITVKSK